MRSLVFALRIILILPFSIAATANDTEVIQSPPQYKVGDSWMYRRTDKLRLDVSRPREVYFVDSVTEITTDGNVILQSPARRGIYTPELNLIPSASATPRLSRFAGSP